MHFSAVALPAFAGVALATNASNTGKVHRATGSTVSKTSSATAMFPTTTIPVVPTPDVTIITEVIITEVIIAEEEPHASTSTGTKTVTSTAAPKAVAIAPAMSTKTLAPTTTAIYKPTPAITKAPTNTVTATTATVTQMDVAVELDDPSDNQPPMTMTGHVLSPVVSSAATRRVQVPGIFRLPVQVWKVVSGLFLQGAVTNAHETPRTMTTTKTHVVDSTTTEASAIVYVLPHSTEQVWDNTLDNVPPQTVNLRIPGDRVVATHPEPTTTVTGPARTPASTTPAGTTPTAVTTTRDVTTTRGHTVKVPTATKTLEDLDVVSTSTADSGASHNQVALFLSVVVMVLGFFI